MLSDRINVYVVVLVIMVWVYIDADSLILWRVLVIDHAVRDQSDIAALEIIFFSGHGVAVDTLGIVHGDVIDAMPAVDGKSNEFGRDVVAGLNQGQDSSLIPVISAYQRDADGQHQGAENPEDDRQEHDVAC